MGTTAAIEDMRSVEPVAYIRALGLRPEDSYGFLPIDLHDTTPYFFLYRDSPEYAQRRGALPGPESVRGFGPVEVYPTESASGTVEVQDLPGEGGGLSDLIAQATQLQQQWGEQGIPGAPEAPGEEGDRIARIEQLKETGAIDQVEYDQLVGAAEGGDSGPMPGGTEAAPAEANAPDIVAQRLFPKIRTRSSTRQLNHFVPKYANELSLCPEDVYGVFPRRTGSWATDSSSSTVWDDFWIVYRDRPEYAAGRDAWAADMDKKGRWPAAEVHPGVAGPARTAWDKPKVKVEKDRWPREKVVVRKKGSDLGDALREKIGKWGYEPEDSYGFCPDYDNGAIYFAWRK